MGIAAPIHRVLSEARVSEESASSCPAAPKRSPRGAGDRYYELLQEAAGGAGADVSAYVVRTDAFVAEPAAGGGKTRDACPVCYEDAAHFVMTSWCVDKFCGSCFVNWWQANPNHLCPICRANMETPPVSAPTVERCDCVKNIL